MGEDERQKLIGAVIGTISTVMPEITLVIERQGGVLPGMITVQAQGQLDAEQIGDGDAAVGVHRDRHEAVIVDCAQADIGAEGDGRHGGRAGHFTAGQNGGSAIFLGG
jgi:hypothetical protein